MTFHHTRTPTDHWTADNIADLKRHFDDKLSMAAIAERMGRTKNSVIGKVERLGWKRPRPAHETTWTAEKRERVAKLWADGLTVEAIAAVVGATDHAVYKLARRMNLSRRRRLPGEPKPKRIRAKRPSTPKLPPPPPPVLEPALGLPFDDLAKYGCRFPTGEDHRGHLFCGNPQQLGVSYCPAHQRIAHTGERVITPRGDRRPDFVAQAYARRFA